MESTNTVIRADHYYNYSNCYEQDWFNQRPIHTSTDVHQEEPEHNASPLGVTNTEMKAATSK